MSISAGIEDMYKELNIYFVSSLIENNFWPSCIFQTPEIVFPKKTRASKGKKTVYFLCIINQTYKLILLDWSLLLSVRIWSNYYYLHFRAQAHAIQIII